MQPETCGRIGGSSYLANRKRSRAFLTRLGSDVDIDVIDANFTLGERSLVRVSFYAEKTLSLREVKISVPPGPIVLFGRKMSIFLRPIQCFCVKKNGFPLEEVPIFCACRYVGPRRIVIIKHSVEIVLKEGIILELTTRENQIKVVNDMPRLTLKRQN